MRLTQRLLVWTALVITAAALLSALPASAQSNPSALDDILRSISPDQQDAILRQLSGGATGTSGARRSETGDQGNERNQPSREQQPPANEEPEPIIPVLKGDDWVIIETDFHLAPRAFSQSLEALYSAQLATPSTQNLQNLQILQALQSGGGGLAGMPLQLPGAAGGLQPQPQQQQAARGPAPSQPEPALTDEQRKTLTEMMMQIRLRNPYQLSHDGVLTLPGFSGIALLGLTEDQASLRLKTEPAFHDVDIRLTRLPLKKSGPEGLKAFGYDLFDHAPSTFAPVTNVPVPADYVVGPGDEFELQLYGTQNRTTTLVVGRDGKVSLPEIGPVNVSGQTFRSVKDTIEGRVAREIIGEHASLSMRDTRSIRVFVLGEAKRPGSYTISGLGTITSALFASGGVRDVGSLRNIQLKRQGAVIRTLDLYDMLLRGDTTDDAKLLPGDVVFIPPVGATASIDGEVRRAAIYEIKSEASIADLIQLSGGLTAEADAAKATVTRLDAGLRSVVRLDLSPAATKSQPLRNGDRVYIARLRPTIDSGIHVDGHVFTRGNVAYRDGIRLSDVIHSVDELRPGADIHYLLIRRELPPDRRIVVLSADLAAALRTPGSDADVPLMPRDRITVFDLFSGRDRVIQPLMTELGEESSMQQPLSAVKVDGRVKVPGQYPLETGMRVSDLVRAGGGLADEAYGRTAELTRYEVTEGGGRRTRLMSIDLAAALRGDANANVTLEPFDDLSIKEVPEWHSQETVDLNGEVRFPGRYAIRRGETLRSVIARAGGLTDYAFPEGSVFTREELKQREQDEIDMLATRMQRDLALLALRGAAANQAGASSALSVGETLLSQLRGTKAVGRLVIDLPRAMRAAPGSESDVILRNGDMLLIPRFRQEVTVIGEVQNVTSHLYRPGYTRDDYISLSGGTSRQADRGRIYVVRANGSVVSMEGSRWFQHNSNGTINPGDTVVVPLDTERMPALPFWQAVTSILYNVAISAAAVHSF